MTNERVTLRDVYDRFDKFEEKMDRRIEDLRNEVIQRLEKVEKRTNILEQFNANLTGRLAAAWFIVNIGLMLAIDYIKERIMNARI